MSMMKSIPTKKRNLPCPERIWSQHSTSSLLVPSPPTAGRLRRAESVNSPLAYQLRAWNNTSAHELLRVVECALEGRINGGPRVENGVTRQLQ